MQIKKASGEKEKFARGKIISSCLRAGCSKAEAEKVAQEVQKEIKAGDSSDKIYRKVMKVLKNKGTARAAKYSLKRAIMSLGPTGYPFEKFVARVLEAHGYKTKVGEKVKGFCISHEVDVTAIKDGRKCYIECKYHNQSGTRSDVKVALYTYGRFQDIQKGQNKKPGSKKEAPRQSWLVTNTKVTSTAAQYANCAGIKVIAWHYPSSGGLEKMVEEAELYPVTVLPFLTKQSRRRLSEAGIITLRDVSELALSEITKKTGLSSKEVQKVKKQAEQVIAD